MVKISVELAGGLSSVFEDQCNIEIPNLAEGLPEGEVPTVQSLIDWLVKNKLKGDSNYFVEKGGQLRGGILVLINDADWSLMEEEKSELSDKDKVCFISTLHGG